MIASPSVVGATIGAIVAYPTIATIVPDMPWFANTGVSGLLGFLLWWNMERGDRRTANVMDSVREEISGMRVDIKSGQDKTHELLSQALFPNRGPK